MEEKKRKTHGIQLLIRCVVRDPDGKVISDTGEKLSKSFVIQFLEFVYKLFDGTGIYEATATDGSEDRFYWYNAQALNHFHVDAGVGASAYGVVVGTGDTAETNEDHALETQLTQGVGAGNITHGQTVIDDAVVVGANVDLILIRAFTNLTGSAIGVKEAGIYTYYSHTIPGPFYHCIARDVLPGTVNVPDMCSLSVYYTLRTTV